MKIDNSRYQVTKHGSSLLVHVRDRRRISVAWFFRSIRATDAILILRIRD